MADSPEKLFKNSEKPVSQSDDQGDDVATHTTYNMSNKPLQKQHTNLELPKHTIDQPSSDHCNLEHVLVNRRPNKNICMLTGMETAESPAESPTESPTESVMNPVMKPRQTWRKSVWLNSQDSKKVDNQIYFPISKQFQSSCSTCSRFCCHKLIDTDDLILQQERKYVRLCMQKGGDIETHTDKNMEHMVDVLLGICCKKPKSCFSYGQSCCNHSGVVWVYRFWQFVFMSSLVYYFVVLGIGQLMCVDSPFFSSTTGSMFLCPAVQNRLNGTYSYQGMIKTMKLLESSNLERDWFRDGEKFSEYFNTSKIRKNGYPQHYKEFLNWHATTSSYLPTTVWLCSNVCLAATFGSLILVFSMRFQSDDPTEIMFPPLLEAKDMNHTVQVSRAAKQLEFDAVEIGSHKSVDEAIYSQSFHFSRQKRFVLQASLWGSLCGAVFLIFMLYFTVLPIGISIFLGILAGLPFGSVAGMLLSGLVVQIHNATTL
jgi:hypothetical protein